MVKKSLDAKSLKSHIKGGWTEKDFCQYYQITNEKFWEIVNIAIPRKGRVEIRKGLKQNARRQNRIKLSGNSYIPNLLDEASINIEEGTQRNEEREPRAETSVEKMPKAEEAKQLTKAEKQAEKKQKQLVALEKRKSRFRKRKEYIQEMELPELKAQLEKYRSLIQEAQRKTEELGQELEDLTDKDREIEKTISVTEKELKDLEKRTDDLQPVGILCYESGKIECISGALKEETLEINGDWVNIVNCHPDECNALTNGQIRSVANLLEIVKGVKFWQVEFENKQVQNLFEKLLEGEKM